MKRAELKLNICGNAFLYDIDGAAKLIVAKCVYDQFSNIKETALSLSMIWRAHNVRLVDGVGSLNVLLSETV